ncbi:MAG: hypothetical protein ACPGJE_05760 [Wenzhouxiangellaceae bacterium]
MTRCLLDTGPLVAYLNASDPFHSPVSSYWDEFRGRFITSSAVVTEAMHFVSASRQGPRVLTELIEVCDIEILD